MRAAIYLRMSTDEQKDSPERQRSQILLYCARKGYHIIGEYADLGLRGYDDSRPDFMRLLADARLHKFDMIVVDEPSRLSRNDPLDFFASVAHPLRLLNVRLDSVAKGETDWNDLASIIMQTVNQHTASTETTTLSRRVQTQCIKDANKGRHNAAVPYGFQYEDKAVRGRFILGKPEEVEIVRFIFDKYVNEDWSLRKISNEIFNLGVSSPSGNKMWCQYMIRYILLNRAYMGDFVYNQRSSSRFSKITRQGDSFISESVKTPRNKIGSFIMNDPSEWIVLEDFHEAIISRETFHRAGKLLKVNQKRTTPKKDRGDVLFSQFVKCGHCGKNFSTKQLLPPPLGRAYVCRTVIEYGKSHCVSAILRERMLLVALVEVIQDRFLEPNNLVQLRAALEKRMLESSLQDETKILERELENVKSKLKRAKDNLLLLDAENIADAQKQIREWNNRKDEITDELKQKLMTNQTVEFEMLISKMNAFAKETILVYEAGHFVKLRLLIRQIFKCVTMTHTEVTKEGAKKRTYICSSAIATFHNGNTIELDPTRFRVPT